MLAMTKRGDVMTAPLQLGFDFPTQYRGFIPPSPHAFLHSLVVQKARSLKAVILDRDGTIQSKNPSAKELSARKSIRQRCDKYVFGTSTAQTPELGMSYDVYNKSTEAGFNRNPAQYLLPNGTRTPNLENVGDLEYLNDFDFVNSFGVGLYLMQKEGGYVGDSAYSIALGGQAWRKRTLGDLYRLISDHVDFTNNLARIDREGMYEAGIVDVESLPFRLQFDFTADEKEKRDTFHLAILSAQFNRKGFRHVEVVDESNLKKGRFTTYLVPKLGLKERSLGRLFKQVEVYSGIGLQQYEKIAIAGDQLTDYQSAIYGLPGSEHVHFILATGSPLAEPLYEGKEKHADIRLYWNRSHPHLQPRFERTDIDGVFKFRAHRLMPWRTIYLADYVPWSRGLGCAESVDANLEYLGF